MAYAIWWFWNLVSEVSFVWVKWSKWNLSFFFYFMFFYSFLCLVFVFILWRTKFQSRALRKNKQFNPVALKHSTLPYSVSLCAKISSAHAFSECKSITLQQDTFLSLFSSTSFLQKFYKWKLLILVLSEDWNLLRKQKSKKRTENNSLKPRDKINS